MLWPALAAASESELAALAAKHFVGLAVGEADGALPCEPNWATPNAIALELQSGRLRDFGTDMDGTPVLLCAPFALHGAAVADLAPGHSLVATLREAGLRHLFLTDWRSATAKMRFRGIDDYLADLNHINVRCQTDAAQNAGRIGSASLVIGEFNPSPHHAARHLKWRSQTG